MSVNNNQLRVRFNSIMKENGLKLIWAADRMKLKTTSLSSWRNDGFQFGKEKLIIVEKFVSKYED